MIAAYRNASQISPELVTIINRVVNDCLVCQKYEKSFAQPRVTLPKLTSFNEIVTLDLKEFGFEYVYLWATEKNNQISVVVFVNRRPKKKDFGKSTRGFATKKLLDKFEKKTELLSALPEPFTFQVTVIGNDYLQKKTRKLRTWKTNLQRNPFCVSVLKAFFYHH